MGHIIPFDQEHDEEDVSQEIDYLISRYLETLKQLKEESLLSKIPSLVITAQRYWHRLHYLLVRSQAKTSIGEDFDKMMNKSLQNELHILENVYLMLDARSKEEFCDECQELALAAQSLLERIDQLLEALGFAQRHADRLLIQETLLEHYIKQKRHYLLKA